MKSPITMKWHNTTPYLVAILEEDVVESVKMEGVAVGQCAVHIEEHCLDCAQIGEWSVSRVGTHCDAGDLDRLCGTTIGCHIGNQIGEMMPGRYKLILKPQCIGHVAREALMQRIKESLPAAYFGTELLTELVRNLRFRGGGLYSSRW